MSHLQTNQVDSEAHPVGKRGSYLGANWLGQEADHSLPASAEFKNNGVILPYTFMACIGTLLLLLLPL